MIDKGPSQEIEAEIVRKNNYGLFIVKDLKYGKHYPFMEQRLDEYFELDFDKRRATLTAGTRVIITVQNDIVTRVRRA